MLLRDLREKAGITQTDLAEQLDRPQSFVSKYESGQRRLDLVELKDIAEALDVSLLDLVREFSAPPSRRKPKRRQR